MTIVTSINFILNRRPERRVVGWLKFNDVKVSSTPEKFGKPAICSKMLGEIMFFNIHYIAETVPNQEEKLCIIYLVGTCCI